MEDVVRRIKEGTKAMKKKTMRSALPLILALLCAGGLNAQVAPALTLQEAIDLGLKNNSQVRASELQVTMQNQLKATAYELPQTEMGGMLGQFNAHSFDQNYTISQGFSPFQFEAKKDVINADIRSSELNVALTKQQIIFNIRRSWNNLLYLSETGELLKRQDSLLLKFAGAAAIKHKAGETNSLESATATVKLQELEQRMKQNEAMVFMEKSRLKLYMNLQGDFVPSETALMVLTAISVTDSTALKQNPELAMAMQEVQKAMANRKLEKSNMLPDLKVGYFIQSLTGNQEVNGQTVYYNGVPRFQGVTFGITVPIFAGANTARNKAAETSVQIQQQNTEYLELQLKSRYEQQLQQLLTYQSLVEYYQSSALPTARTITLNAEKSYRNGDISYLEFIQAIQTSLDIENNYLSAVSTYNQAVINMQYLLNQ